MEYKIIASDLDGTFLGRDEKGSPENYKALERLQELGVQFVPTSGRSFWEMPEQLRNCPHIRYYIGSDGGTVYDKQTDTIHSLAMPEEVGQFVLDKLYQYPVSIMLHADNRSYVDADCHFAANYIAHNYNDSWLRFVLATNKPVENFKAFAYAHGRIESFCVFFRNLEDLQECKAYFEKHPALLVAQTDPLNLELFWVNAGKGNALMYLADILGIDRAATIAVGDSTNDMTMVRQAGLGLAMANAVEALKEAADAVICDNSQHSAKYILEHFILQNPR